MILKIKKGVIFVCEDGIEDTPIGSIFENAPEEAERIIECGSEVLPAVKDFVDRVSNGSLKPKKAYDEFESILKKHELQ